MGSRSSSASTTRTARETPRRRARRRSRVSGAIDGIREATTLPLLWIGRRRARRCRRRRSSGPRTTHDARRTSSSSSTSGTRRSSSSRSSSSTPRSSCSAARTRTSDVDPLDAVLELLPDVPAGKLAIAARRRRDPRRGAGARARRDRRGARRRAVDVGRPGRPPARSTSRPARATMAPRERAAVDCCSPAPRRCASLLVAGCSAVANEGRAPAPATAAPKPRVRASGRLAEAREQDQGARLLPRLAARSADRRSSAARGTTSTRSRRTAATSRASSGRRPAAARPAASCTSTCAAIPGRTKIPTCRTGGIDSQNVPCFASPNGTDHRERDQGAPSTRSTRTPTSGTSRSSGAHDGNLYTLSEHVAPPLTYNHVVRYLKHELDSARADQADRSSLMKLTRRQALAGAAAGAVGASGIYELDRPARAARTPRARRPRRRGRPSSICSTASGSCSRDGIEVLVPPLHHEIITARVAVGRARSARRAGARSSTCSPASTRDYEPTPAGLGVTVGVGPAVLRAPRPGRATAATCRTTAAPSKPVLFDAERFPSDPRRHEARVERRRDPPALRRARAHRRCDEAPRATRSCSS